MPETHYSSEVRSHSRGRGDGEQQNENKETLELQCSNKQSCVLKTDSHPGLKIFLHITKEKILMQISVFL